MIVMTSKQQQKVEDYLYIVKNALLCVPYSNQSIQRCPDDLYQEGCLSLCKLIISGHDENKENFEDYAFIAIRNRLIDCCRQGKRIEDPLIHEKADCLECDNQCDVFSTLSSSEDISSEILDSITLGDALLAINDAKQNCNGVILKGIDSIIYKINGFSVTDIAEIYGVTPNNVGAWISRAKKHLHSNEAFSRRLSQIIVENNCTIPSLYLEVAI